VGSPFQRWAMQTGMLAAARGSGGPNRLAVWRPQTGPRLQVTGWTTGRSTRPDAGLERGVRATGKGKFVIDTGPADVEIRPLGSNNELDLIGTTRRVRRARVRRVVGHLQLSWHSRLMWPGPRAGQVRLQADRTPPRGRSPVAAERRHRAGVVVSRLPHGSGAQLPSPPVSMPFFAAHSLGFCGSQTNEPADVGRTAVDVVGVWRGVQPGRPRHTSSRRR